MSPLSSSTNMMMESHKILPSSSINGYMNTMVFSESEPSTATLTLKYAKMKESLFSLHSRFTLLLPCQPPLSPKTSQYKSYRRLQLAICTPTSYKSQTQTFTLSLLKAPQCLKSSSSLTKQKASPCSTKVLAWLSKRNSISVLSDLVTMSSLTSIILSLSPQSSSSKQALPSLSATLEKFSTLDNCSSSLMSILKSLFLEEDPLLTRAPLNSG